MDEIPGNMLPRRIGDELLERLHAIQAECSGEMAIAAALSAITAALNFIHAGAGDKVAAAACDMVAEIARKRLDIVVPAGRVRR